MFLSSFVKRGSDSSSHSAYSSRTNSFNKNNNNQNHHTNPSNSPALRSSVLVHPQRTPSPLSIHTLRPFSIIWSSNLQKNNNNIRTYSSYTPNEAAPTNDKLYYRHNKVFQKSMTSKWVFHEDQRDEKIDQKIQGKRGLARASFLPSFLPSFLLREATVFALDRKCSGDKNNY